MDKKTYTILITSNRRGQTRSVGISAAWLKAGLLAVFVTFVIMGAVAVDYVGLLLEAGESKRLRAENTHLKRQFQMVESKLSALETGLERVQNFTKKLKLITNIEDEDRSLKLAIGPMPKAGQSFPEYYQAMQDRAPASEFLSREQGWKDSIPLDERGGELSTQRDQDYASLSIRIDRAVKDTQLKEQGVLKLWEALSERQSLLNATPSIKPTRGWFTSRFGYRIDPFTGKPVMHSGIDIAASPGTPIYAPADGVISYVGYESGYGKMVSIDHGYGVITRYAHNSRIFVEQGQRVSRRDVIASVGSTGRSTGPHLHYEVRVHGVAVDPMNYILDE